jgi:putative hydrolase of the HAD superfamily
MSTDRRILLFDLGGVLIEFAGLTGFQALLAEPVPQDELLRRWLRTDHLEQFELGRLSPEQFADALARDWDLTVTPAQFLVEWQSWTRQLYPGALDLLDRLRPRYRLAALSNSNVLHWQRNVEDLRILDIFERAFSSHELGVRKPDRAIYEHALRELAARPEHVVFFDDTFPNVEAARALGIEAYQVRGIEGLIATLIENGLLT